MKMKDTMDKDITILAIESSCDETAASVVVNGRDVLSNVISSQIDIHTLYGGVVPEIASRKHTERINQVVKKGLSEAGKTLQDMDAIAVTYGPGLVGPLLIGVSEAKALSFATGIPLIGVHHIEGHISANYIANKVAVDNIIYLYINEFAGSDTFFSYLRTEIYLCVNIGSIGYASAEICFSSNIIIVEIIILRWV